MSFHLDKEFHRHYLKTVVEKVGRSIFISTGPLDVTCWRTKEPVPFDQRRSGEERALQIGDAWGELWDCAWMHLRGSVPDFPEGKSPVLLLDVEGEGCLYNTEGVPLVGITHMQKPSFIFPQGKKVYWLPEQTRGGDALEFWLDAGANDLFGKPNRNPGENTTLGHLALAHVGYCQDHVRDLYYDLLFLGEMLEVLPKSRTRYHRILKVMTDAACILHEYTDGEAAMARAILRPEVERKGPEQPSLTLHTIGHAHLDLAWLWPIRETKRKAIRSYSTVLSNMKRYPEYTFTSSQPQLLEWIRESSPELFEGIRKRVAEGRWELQGGMWVEADNMMSGGESLARQFLHGQRYFREHFGVTTNILWLPDCFGYSAQLPQLATQAGIDYFMTIKPSWNLFNKLPFSTFVWQGLDGSELLGHMPPADCYNTPATPISLRNAEEQFQDKAISDQALLVFGVGDGGGGPGAEHLEALRRERNTEGLPATRMGRADEFYRRLGANLESYERWSGEIYLERHQGTFTSQAWNKRFNRLCETLLHQAELLSILRFVSGSAEYPREAIDRIWREVLLYQFHDILPGSSIGRVHQESQERYRSLVAQLQGMIDGDSSTSNGSDERVFALNSLSWDRESWIKLESGWAKGHIPALGVGELTPMDSYRSLEKITVGEDMLSNGLLTLRFEADGTISSLYDHAAKRELVPMDDSLNRLTLYNDWWAAETSDAWDMNPSYREQMAGTAILLESESLADGPRAVRRQVLAIGSSRIEQEIELMEGSRRIDFITRIDWQERGKMLRASFPVNIHSDFARCETQFGHVIRPIHENTVHDKARFEVCAQKWIDLSQADLGIALLNNGKYGHSLHKGRMEINLLRSPTYPDPEADTGIHEFTYALFPHLGGPVTGKVIQAAYELNQPVRILRGTAGASLEGLVDQSLFRISSPQVILEGIKLAEDDDSIILRLYESFGGECSVCVKSAFLVQSAKLTDLLEEETSEVPTTNGSIDLAFKPFEIKTLRLVIDKTQRGVET